MQIDADRPVWASCAPAVINKANASPTIRTHPAAFTADIWSPFDSDWRSSALVMAAPARSCHCWPVWIASTIRVSLPFSCKNASPMTK